jgi:hypothetical protein
LVTGFVQPQTLGSSLSRSTATSRLLGGWHEVVQFLDLEHPNVPD